MTTNGTGQYTLQNLTPSTYKLSVSKEGFRDFVRAGITLAVNQNATVNVQMEVGQGVQSVTVEAGAPLLPSQDATTGQSVDRTLINDLPLVGRSVFDLAFLAPGINPPPTSVFGLNTMANNFASNGGRNAMSDILIDGVTATAPEQNTQFLNPLYTPSVDAVQEFKVEQNNFSADKGFSGNTVLNVVMRSGTNQFHGSLYEFWRNNALNANNWFNNRAGLPLPGTHNHDFGGTFGGPIRKNKTFFFFDYEGTRSISAASAAAGVPSALERAGDFGELCGYAGGNFNAQGICSAATAQLYDPYSGVYDSSSGARVLQTPIPFNNMATYASPGSSVYNPPGFTPNTPGNVIDPTAMAMMSHYLLPSVAPGSPGYNRFNNWAGTGANTGHNNQYDIKVDHQLSDATHLNARWSNSYGGYQGFNPWNNPENTNTQGPIHSGAQSAVVNFNHNFSPTTLFNFSYGWTRSASYTLGVDKSFPNFDPIKDLKLPTYMAASQISASPTIYIDGGYNYVGPESLGAQAWSVLHYALETHDLLASLTKMQGRHEFHLGGEMRVHKDDFEQPGAPAGVFEYSNSTTAQYAPWASQFGSTGQGDGLASFLTGIGGPGSWGEYEIPLTIATQNFEYAGFFQDNWKATDKLTLNLGVRYDLYMPETERHNQQAWLNASVTNPLKVATLSPSDQATFNTAFSGVGLPVPDLSSLKGGLEFASASNRYPVDPWKKGFAPRIGLAYRLPHDTVLRAGYGLFYATPDYTASGTGLGVYPGFLQTTGWLTTYQGNGYTAFGRLNSPFPCVGAACNGNPYGGALAYPPGSSLGLLTDLGVGVSAHVRNWNQVPYDQTWSFGLQHEFKGVLVDAEYVGTKGTHLYYASAGGLQYFGPWIEKATTAQLNALNTYIPNPFSGVINTPGCSICGGYIQAVNFLKPYPQFNGFGGPNPPWANSTYNAFQLRLEKRFSHGLEFLANYTWSKAIDDASVSGSNTTWLGGTAPQAQDPNNLEAEGAVSEYDIPQVLSFSYVYALPFGKGKQWGNNWGRALDYMAGGWQTQGFWRFDSGQPIELTLANGASLPTYGTQRPDLVGKLNQNNCSETCMLNQYFANPDALVKPAQYALGTAPRVYGGVHNPGTQNASLSLFKEIPFPRLGEASHFEIRVEAFNALNHVQFCGPNTSFLGFNADGTPSGSFGQVTCQANSPRQIQLGAKFYF